MFQVIKTCFFLFVWLIIQQKSWVRKIIHEQCLLVFKSCNSIFPATLHSHFNPKPAPYVTGICVFSPYNHTHNKQQKAGLLPVSSVTGGSNPAVSPGKTPGCCHSCYSFCLSVSGEWIGLTEVFFVWLEKEDIRVHRNWSLVLFAARWQAWLTPQNLPFFCIPSLCLPLHPPGPQAGLVSTAEQAADSTVTSLEDDRQWREGGRKRD